jgi:hypothetical protein
MKKQQPLFRNFYKCYRCHKNGKMCGRRRVTMIVHTAAPAIAALTSQKMKTMNNSQPFGAVFLFRHSRGYPKCGARHMSPYKSKMKTTNNSQPFGAVCLFSR